MTVVGELVEAQVGDDGQPGAAATLARTARARMPVGSVAQPPSASRRAGMPKSITAPTPASAAARTASGRGGFAVLDHPGHQRQWPRLGQPVRDEQRLDEVGRVQPGLGDEATQPGVLRSRRGRSTGKPAPAARDGVMAVILLRRWGEGRRCGSSRPAEGGRLGSAAQVGGEAGGEAVEAGWSPTVATRVSSTRTSAAVAAASWSRSQTTSMWSVRKPSGTGRRGGHRPQRPHGSRR